MKKMELKMLPESAPCSQFPYDYSLDNMALHYVKFALQVAAKIASRSWALIYVQVRKSFVYSFKRHETIKLFLRSTRVM